MYCPKCGKENEDNSRFCQGCGSPLQKETSTSVELGLNLGNSDSRKSYIDMEKQRRNQMYNMILAVLIPIGVILILYLLFYFAVLPKSNEISWMMGKKLSSVKMYHSVDSDKDTEDIVVTMGNAMLMSLEDDGHIDEIVIDGSGRYAIKGIQCGQSIDEAVSKIERKQDYQLLKEQDATINGNWGKVKAYRCAKEDAYLIIYYYEKKVERVLYCDRSMLDDSFDKMGSDSWSDDEVDSDDSYDESDDTDYGDDSYYEDDSDYSDDSYYDDSDYSDDSYYDDSDYDDSYYSDDSYYDDSDYDDDYYSDDSDEYYEDGFYFPDSDTRKLTKSDLAGLSKEELRIARNEIYARHGRLFVDSGLQAYFDSCDWYYGYIEPEDFNESKELNATERRNARFILKHE